ncbi:MAG: hypothetical protein GQE15_24530 [Archangiaceae bacterium]|nr:hypothetical protein [Archangiaceae bacterium]
MRLLVLVLVVAGAPDVTLPEKQPVALPVDAHDNAEAVRAGVRAARPALEACWLRDGGVACTCAALRTVRFDVVLDGGVMAVTFPLVGHRGPSFTIDQRGRLADCR